jgi:signal transduction histidine kinase
MDRVLVAIGRLRRGHPRTVDGLIAVGLAVGNVYSVSQDDPAMRYEYTEPGPLLWTCAVVAGLVLAWRQRWPLPVHLVVLVCAAVPSAMGYNAGSLPLSVAFSTYSVAAWSERRVGVAGLLATMGALAVLTAVQAPDFRDGDALGAFVTFAAVWVIGNAQRDRRHRLEEAEARAREVEERRADEAERAVAAERLRVAQELHDVVAHAMSAMVVQAGGARRLAEKDPARARAGFAAVEETGREALTEIRRLLGVLRHQDDEIALAPQPSLRHLAALVRRVEAAGLPIDLRVDGAERPLPAGVDLTAYRLVQAALGDALERGGAGRAEVRVRYRADGIDLDVTDDGSGARPLAGVRERVGLYGGQLHAGRRRRGGHAVRAKLPVGGAT